MPAAAASTTPGTRSMNPASAAAGRVTSSLWGGAQGVDRLGVGLAVAPELGRRAPSRWPRPPRPPPPRSRLPRPARRWGRARRPPPPAGRRRAAARRVGRAGHLADQLEPGAQEELGRGQRLEARRSEAAAADRRGRGVEGQEGRHPGRGRGHQAEADGGDHRRGSPRSRTAGTGGGSRCCPSAGPPGARPPPPVPSTASTPSTWARVSP